MPWLRAGGSAAPDRAEKDQGRFEPWLNADLASALNFEAVNQGVCFQTDDFKEGVQAFLEKRKAQFQENEPIVPERNRRRSILIQAG
jgi:enoyl-CoA hydratase/carnithine racemase